MKIKKLSNLLKGNESGLNRKIEPYDTQAEVRRIENGIAWVHIAGGVDETPVNLTINAKVGDTVQVRVGGGRAWLTGNATNPPTDDTTANKAQNTANVATKTAEAANTAAQSAQQAADTAWGYADDAYSAAQAADKSAGDAQKSADDALISATNANEYAVRAFANLGAVESVTETLTWITNHGTMALTTDTVINPTHVYFVQDANGDYMVQNQSYSLVPEPNIDDIDTYYVLSIDESLNNFVATHLALTNEGLNIINQSDSSYRMLITPSAVQIKDLTGDVVASYGSAIELGVNNVVTTITNENMTCARIFFTELRPSGTSLALIARTNGHFSIKPVA